MVLEKSMQAFISNCSEQLVHWHHFKHLQAGRALVRVLLVRTLTGEQINTRVLGIPTISFQYERNKENAGGTQKSA